MFVSRILRIVAAVAALVAGYAHLKLYNDGYKDIPIANIGTQFLLNALGAVVIAAGLVAPLVVRTLPSWVRWSAPVAGIGWSAMSLLAFWLSRTSRGWMGFRDGPGLNPAPEAALSVFPEIAVLVCCVALLIPIVTTELRSRRG
ncbi:MAG: hypothetical protein HKN44_11760 [Ilumatobacter sp.]|nr:hypothetical protein [Ilumatobacter sp.]